MRSTRDPNDKETYSTSTEGNRGQKEQHQRRLRKRRLEVNSRYFKLYLAYSVSFNSLIE